MDEGPLPPHPILGIKYNMETFDEVIRDSTIDFIDRAKKDGKPFFVWMNPTRVHVITHLSPKYQAMRDAGEHGGTWKRRPWRSSTTTSAAVMQHLKDAGLDKNTIVVFTTDNGAETFTWPDGGNTPFAGRRAPSWKAACACR